MRTTYIRFCSTALAQAASSKVGELAEGRRAVVVDENVDAAELSGRRFDDPRAVLGASAIRENRQYLGTGLRADPGRGLRQVPDRDAP